MTDQKGMDPQVSPDPSPGLCRGDVFDQTHDGGSPGAPDTDRDGIADTCNKYYSSIDRISGAPANAGSSKRMIPPGPDDASPCQAAAADQIVDAITGEFNVPLDLWINTTGEMAVTNSGNRRVEYIYTVSGG